MKKKILYKISFAIMLMLFVNNALFAQTTALTGTIRTGSETLQSATVSIAGKATMTDHKAQFSFALNPGTYLIVITHAGYKKIESNITIVAGKENKVEFNMVPNDLLDQITITTMGSKTGTARSNLNTAVPVDVITSARLEQTGQPNFIQMLSYTLPSLYAEGQKIYEPITYRGTSPHHLLILLNNTRYHSSAWLNNAVPRSDLGRGSASNDLGSIPFIAIEKVEILRDGASAQYGSDAIAAVLNVRLKESTGKTTIMANTGQYFKGDGFRSWIGLYKGVRLKNKRLSEDKQGFIGFSGELRTQAPTTRVQKDTGLVYEIYTTAIDSAITKAKDDSTILANGFNRNNLTKNIGGAKLYSFGFLVNGAYHFSNHLKVFWTGTVNYKQNYWWANYRKPNENARVNKLLYPHGTQPINRITFWDVTTIAGIKGVTRSNWQWELSSSFGKNANPNEVYNSNNASQQNLLGTKAPTSFYLGNFVYNLFTNNLSFTKELASKNSNWRSNKLIAGAEWRLENYKMVAGDKAAYTDYDSTGPKQGGAQPLIGTVDDNDVVNKNRSASSVYFNWEIEPNDRLLIDAASRYEYYSDFGSNLAGKLAVRYKFTPKFTVRSSISNGYRAPGLQQRYFSGIQQFQIIGLTQKVFNNESPVTRAFYIPSLTAERALNLSAGITSKLSSSISFTLDAYMIQIKNRIVLSGAFQRKDPTVDFILRDHPGIDAVQFYTNAINTRTYGIDAVLNANWNIHKTRIGLTLAGNINRNAMFGGINTSDVIKDIHNYKNILFGIQERTALKKEHPGEKIILSLSVNKGKYGFTLRNIYFGRTGIIRAIDTLLETYSPRIITDCSIKYNPRSWMTITIGANNIFDVYAALLDSPNEDAARYKSGAIPYGKNGGYYYLNVSFNF
jgi:iron complex outermembrane receptor protein